ncbi:MAG: TIGR01212 family radical SAM protein [Treponema sp.]|nr:TIGR01212 family radical SAM protein [Treponema sp.]MBO4533656.1 TIGR01212 family radical SAM protein [Treponema sp.]
MHTWVGDYYKNLFGTKVYKLTFDAGCTCPTRDGTKGTRGCIFCSQSGSGEFTVPFDGGASIVPERFKGADTFIAYFQNFTNTYGDLKELSSKWHKALSYEGIKGLALGTRPDCLGDEVLEELARISDEYFVQLELGFQTVNEESAQYIRRGFTNDVYFDAVARIHKMAPKVHVVTHVIFGLPGETEADMLNSVKAAVDAGTDGIKIMCLYVLKDTDLALEYEQGKFEVLQMDEYFELLRKALPLIPESVIIHRLTGDPPKSTLIAPKWTTDKKRVMDRIKKLEQ